MTITLDYPPRQMNRVRIEHAAQQLLEQRDVLAVQLFGSYSRGEDTKVSDCDLIVVASDAAAYDWLNAIEKDFVTFDTLSDTYYVGSARRRWAFERHFRPVLPDPDEFYDIFVFPSDWQREAVLKRLQIRGNHRDPEFMSNIARDAITYDPFTRSFPWP